MLSAGSVEGAANLVIPQFATSSLFSLSDGLLLSLSQSDYMSIISLVPSSSLLHSQGEDSQPSVDLSTVMSSLNVPVALPSTSDPLYDSHAALSPELPQPAASSSLAVYGEEMERLHDLFLDSPGPYYRIQRIIDGLFTSGLPERQTDRFCNTLQEELQLAGVSLFLVQNNLEYVQIVRVSCWHEA